MSGAVAETGLRHRNITALFSCAQTHRIERRSPLAISSTMLTEIPTLEKLCQEVLANEATKYGSKKINELCKRIPSHLLESILQSLLDRNQVTDVALNMFLVPSRTNLVMNGFCKIKNSTFKQIGYSCPNLVRACLISVCRNLKLPKSRTSFISI